MLLLLLRRPATLKFLQQQQQQQRRQSRSTSSSRGIAQRTRALSNSRPWYHHQRHFHRLEQTRLLCYYSNNSSSSSSSSSNESRSSGDVPAVDEIVAKVRSALRLDWLVQEEANPEVTIWGSGNQYGMPSQWVISYNVVSGAFQEQIRSTCLECETGFQGVSPLTTETSWKHVTVWERDEKRLTQCLHFDEKEVIILGSWLRSGVWTLPSLQKQLSITHHTNDHRNFHDAAATLPSAFSPVEAHLNVSLDGGLVQSTIAVCLLTYKPTRFHIRAFGGVETWELMDWQESPAGLPIPMCTQHTDCNDRTDVFRTTSVSHCSSELSSTAPATEPTIPTTSSAPLPTAAAAMIGVDDGRPSEGVMTGAGTFNDPSRLLGCPPPLHAWLPQDFRLVGGRQQQGWSTLSARRTPGGHVLVQVVLNRCWTGEFMLDSGATGLIISPDAANELHLTEYGTVFVAGIGGKQSSCFRQAESLRIGELEIEKPLLMEMSIDHLVTGARVSGILGSDFFARAVVDIPAVPADYSGKMDIHIAHPDSDITAADAAGLQGKRDISWCKVYFIAKIPHIEIDYAILDVFARRGLFMVDTGAGGAEFMFNSRTSATIMKSLDPGHHQNDESESRASKAAILRPVTITGTGGGLAAKEVKLDWARFGDMRVSSPRALLASKPDAGMDISYYTDGLVCQGVLGKFSLIFDCHRSRMGVYTMTN